MACKGKGFACTAYGASASAACRGALCSLCPAKQAARARCGRLLPGSAKQGELPAEQAVCVSDIRVIAVACSLKPHRSLCAAVCRQMPAAESPPPATGGPPMSLAGRRRRWLTARGRAGRSVRGGPQPPAAPAAMRWRRTLAGRAAWCPRPERARRPPAPASGTRDQCGTTSRFTHFCTSGSPSTRQCLMH